MIRDKSSEFYDWVVLPENKLAGCFTVVNGRVSNAEVGHAWHVLQLSEHSSSMKG